MWGAGATERASFTASLGDAISQAPSAKQQLMRSSLLSVIALCGCGHGAAIRVLEAHSSIASAVSRRAALLSPLVLLAPLSAQPAKAVATTEAEIMKDLQAVVTALQPLPALLEEEKWDAVRSVLKVPPVGNLWNLGESKNTLRKLAELRDDVELFEVADDVAGALQLADQFTYDNNVRHS